MTTYFPLTLVTILIPALFWACYHYWKDRHQPEPILYLLLTLLLGIGSGYMGQLAYETLDLLGLRQDAYALGYTNRLGLFIYAVSVIGVIEELVKFIPFYVIVLRFRYFDELMDGIIYASFIGLGFSIYENFVYAQFADQKELLARGVASPPVHFIFASIWGYSCGYAKLTKRPLFLYAFAGLVVAVLLHGCYDFLVIGLPGWGQVVSSLIILFIWVWRMYLIRRLQPRGMAN